MRADPVALPVAAALPAPRRSLLGLLLRTKALLVWNRTQQAVNEAPVRLSAAVILIGVIWLGLYAMFRLVFEQFERTPLEATVAIPLVFNFFFLAMLVMLTFSNAIISYGALFGRAESEFLLAMPTNPLDVVTLKYLESLVAASWSLLVLGLPLMLAMAEQARDPAFYFLFLAFFLAFIPVPAALGLLLAWGAARYFPRRAIRISVVIGGAAIAALLLWGMRSLRLGDVAADVWLRSFLGRMSFIESAFLPNNWVARGIDNAIHQRWEESVLYLGVTIANAWFASWLAVMVVARSFEQAHQRAIAWRGGGRRLAADAAGGIAGAVFFYLPASLRLIAAKDLRSFLRDPMQWSQLVILFGLMLLYLANMPTLRVELPASGWFLIIPFLNLCAVSLILATFTCRFVFPLVSLEGRTLWLVGLLPMRRGRILLAKYAFALTVTLLVALCATGLAAFVLELTPVWAVIHLSITVAICFGLCGFSVGIGARLPMFRHQNVAGIANGLGGTTNLLASIALVAVVLTGVGMATYRSRDAVDAAVPDAVSLGYCAAAAIFSISAGLVALWIGARHLNRLEV